MEQEIVGLKLLPYHHWLEHVLCQKQPYMVRFFLFSVPLDFVFHVILFEGTTKHAIQGFFLNLSREIKQSKEYSKHIGVTLVILGLIRTDNAMKETDEKIHFLAADLRRTAQFIIQSGVQGKTTVFYPRLYYFVPQIYFLFSPLFDLLSRLGD